MQNVNEEQASDEVNHPTENSVASQKDDERIEETEESQIMRLKDFFKLKKEKIGDENGPGSGKKTVFSNELHLFCAELSACGVSSTG